MISMDVFFSFCLLACLLARDEKVQVQMVVKKVWIQQENKIMMSRAESERKGNGQVILNFRPLRPSSASSRLRFRRRRRRFPQFF